MHQHLSVQRSGAGSSRRDCRIRALDDLSLGATVFEPYDRREHKAVIFASATGVKRERYEKFAIFLAQQGWSVVSFDYRGIGDSREGNLRSAAHTMHEWGSKDIAGIIRWVTDTWRPYRLVAVTHSIGGQVIPFAHNQDRVHAMLAIAAQNGYWRLWSGHQRLLCLAFFGAIPALVRLFGYMPMRVAGCEALPPKVALEWRRWGLSPDFIDGDGASLNDHYASFTAPILALSFSDDIYAPRRSVDNLLDLYRSSRREHRHIHPSDLGATEIGHSGFFTSPLCRSLWEDVATWLSTA